MLINYFVLLIALPLAWSYAIKVSGKVELGEDLARVLNEFRDKFLQEDTIGEILSTLGGTNSKFTKENKIKQKTKYNIAVEPKDGYDTDEKISKREKKELSLLDEMVAKDGEKMHVFGKHIEKKKRHRNNINA